VRRPLKVCASRPNWDIFYYVFGVLHHPEYRAKYAENLKRELPRIPLAKDFYGFSKAGKELAQLHIEYESMEPYPLKFMETGSSVAAVYRPPAGVSTFVLRFLALCSSLLPATSHI